MIHPTQMRIAAFYCNAEGAYYCRACTVKVLGELCVAKMEVGLAHPDGWSVATLYEIEESAGERGYACAGQYMGEPPHPRNADGYCPLCDEELCFECGVRLDDPVAAAA